MIADCYNFDFFPECYLDCHYEDKAALKEGLKKVEHNLDEYTNITGFTKRIAWLEEIPKAVRGIGTFLKDMKIQEDEWEELTFHFCCQLGMLRSKSSVNALGTIYGPMSTYVSFRWVNGDWEVIKVYRDVSKWGVPYRITGGRRDWEKLLIIWYGKVRKELDWSCFESLLEERGHRYCPFNGLLNPSYYGPAFIRDALTSRNLPNLIEIAESIERGVRRGLRRTYLGDYDEESVVEGAVLWLIAYREEIIQECESFIRRMDI